MSITLNCYFPAEDPCLVEVDIPSHRRVSTLLKMLQLELHAFGREDLKTRDLRLFKTDIPSYPIETRQLRVLQWLHEQPSNARLDAGEKLSRVFHNEPDASDDKLDIIIADAEVLEMRDVLGDPSGTYNKRVKKALNECLNARLALPSPSEAVKDAQTLNQVFGGEERIYTGRPGEAPAVIFNPALAALKQDLDNLEQIQISTEDVSLAGRYIRSATLFYKDEDQRQCALAEPIAEAFGGSGKWTYGIDLEPNNTSKIKGKKITPDCSWWQGAFAVLVLELKNSSGLAGDSLQQAIVDYSKIVSGDQYKPFREYSNFPVVLVGVTANRLEIAVAVSAGSIYVSKLLTLDVSLGFHASDRLIRLARVFNALSRCRKELEDYYDGITSSGPLTLSCLFPNPTLIDPSKTLPKLIYRQFLSRAGQPTSDLVDLGNATTAMYIAILEEQEVIVKFTARYNEAAHRLLAEARLAPKLFFCERVVGDLYMIVMERVSGTSIWQLRQDKMPIPQTVPTEVEKAVGLLHERDIVFGDLRSNNILYVRSGDEERVVLVDFDWAGKDGEGRYPATLNTKTTWGKQVKPYGIMCKSHDLWQVAQLRDLCIRFNA